jgi:uncharacterized membrane protein YkvA (DUF1232 family)
MNEKQSDYYRSLRKKIKNWIESKEGKENQWSEYILWAPDLFHLLVKLSLDKNVPSSQKAKLAAAIAYFISPLDVIPEMILGPVGYVDDIALAAYVLNSVINKTDPLIIQKHWAGEADVLEVIKKILTAADRMVGQGLWQKVRRTLGH